MPLLRIGSRLVASRLSPTRFFGPTISTIGIFAVVYLLITGKINLSNLDMGTLAGQLGDPDDPTIATPIKLDTNTARVADRIRIATFSVTNWNDTKAADPNIMQVIATVVSSFDLVAIQGISSPQNVSVTRVLEMLNRGGSRYAADVSEPIGPRNLLMQYAFLYDMNRIRMIPESNYTIRDDADRMRYEPRVASFETRASQNLGPGQAPFRFTILNCNIDPNQSTASQTQSELSVLDDVFVRVRDYEYKTRGEDDVILVGNLNVDARNLGELGLVPEIISIAANQATTTVNDRTVDHILIDRSVSTEFSARFGVMNLQQAFSLTLGQAMSVSEHRPVWAEFNVVESSSLPIKR